jgi:hypothetical protein
MEILGVGFLAAEDYNLENYLEKSFLNSLVVVFLKRQKMMVPRTGKDHQKYSFCTK